MRRNKLSKQKQKKLVGYFVVGATGRNISEILDINKNTICLYFSYFGGSRKGKRGHEASSKTPVFGILKRRGNVYTSVIKDVKSETLYPNLNIVNYL